MGAGHGRQRSPAEARTVPKLQATLSNCLRIEAGVDSKMPRYPPRAADCVLRLFLFSQRLQNNDVFMRYFVTKKAARNGMFTRYVVAKKAATNRVFMPYVVT